MSQKTFDVTLRGYYGGSSITDHLVKWVKSNSFEELMDWIMLNDLTEHIHSVDYMPDCDEYQEIDGVDCDIASCDPKLIELWKHEVDNLCPYCGGRCPTNEKYDGGEHLCDGFSGNIDELISS